MVIPYQYGHMYVCMRVGANIYAPYLCRHLLCKYARQCAAVSHFVGLRATQIFEKQLKPSVN